MNLSPEKFWEKGGRYYCEADYNNLFLSKCYACTKTIFEVPVKFLQRTYHPLCFTCKKCSEVVCPYNFEEKFGNPYCEEDYHRLFSPKCYSCGLPIRDEKDVTRALGGTFHSEHFVCYACAKPLPANNFRQKEGEVYCEDDYHNIFSPRCAFCDDPIRHDGLIALGKKWHRDCCLRCGACNKVLKEDNYIQVADKAYCRSDWRQLFAPKCWTCKNPVSQVLTGDSVVALGRDYHPECFMCKDCNGGLDERSFYEWEGEPYCYEHYHLRTCNDCAKVREEKKKNAKKILGDPKNTRKSSSRSMSPMSFLFRSKSTSA
jgi:paxillin